MFRVAGKVGVLGETWWDGGEVGWVGLVEWLQGSFASARSRTGSSCAKFKEEGASWPCLLPNFGRWCRINCALLLPVWADREAPLKPHSAEGRLWVWETQQEVGEEAPLHLALPPTVGSTVASAFVERARAWWEGGGKVCIASNGSLKRIRLPDRKELVPLGSTGWVYGSAPAEFQEGEPNEAMGDVEWKESSGKSIDLSP